MMKTIIIWLHITVEKNNYKLLLLILASSMSNSTLGLVCQSDVLRADLYTRQMHRSAVSKYWRTICYTVWSMAKRHIEDAGANDKCHHWDWVGSTLHRA